jgi:hypothetical protein
VWVAVLLGSALAHVAGVFVGQRGFAAASGVAALAVLGSHPSIRHAETPRRVRLLLWGGLAALAVEIVVRARPWHTAPSELDVRAGLASGALQQEIWQREAQQALWTVLGCACLVAAAVWLPRGRLGRLARDVPGVGVLFLAASTLLYVLSDGAAELFGSTTNAVAAALVIGAGSGWIAARALARRGPTALVAAGLAVLTVLVCVEVADASQARPEPRPDGVFQSAGILVVRSGPAFAWTGAAVTALLLVGAALVVLGRGQIHGPDRAAAPAS